MAVVLIEICIACTAVQFADRPAIRFRRCWEAGLARSVVSAPLALYRPGPSSALHLFGVDRVLRQQSSDILY